jgi:hypothetical protein
MGMKISCYSLLRKEANRLPPRLAFVMPAVFGTLSDWFHPPPREYKNLSSCGFIQQTRISGMLDRVSFAHAQINLGWRFICMAIKKI